MASLYHINGKRMSSRTWTCFCNIFSVQQRDIVPLGPLGRNISSSQKFHQTVATSWIRKWKFVQLFLDILFPWYTIINNLQIKVLVSGQTLRRREMIIVSTLFLLKIENWQHWKYLYIIGAVCLSVTKNDHFAQGSQIKFFSGSNLFF